jgi:glutathione S-transferase
MITLYRFVPAWGTPDLSSFCSKVEIYLRMVGLPYETRTADARKAPLGKLPYVDDEGKVICDSRNIIEHFEARLPTPLDHGLGAQERALCCAFRALLEEECYFYTLRLRWVEDDGFAQYLPTLTQYGKELGMPGWLAPLLLRSVVRKGVIKSTYGQGAGRHSLEEIDRRMCEAVEATATQLGQGPYFLGERPRVIDATVFSFLWSLRAGPFESRARRLALASTSLSAYCEHMQARYFGECPVDAAVDVPVSTHA